MKIIVRANDGSTHTFNNQTKETSDYAVIALTLGRACTLIEGRSTVTFAAGTMERIVCEKPAPEKGK